MGEKVPSTTSVGSSEKTEQREPKNAGRQSSGGQPQQRCDRIEALEVTSIERGPIDGEDSQPQLQLGPEYHVKFGEPADFNGELACTIPVPDLNRSRADSQLGRVLVANGHGQNADPEKLVGEPIKCGRVDGQWQVIDPDLDPDDPRFTESRSEGIRQTLRSIIMVVYLPFVLLLSIVMAITVGYGLYYLVFVSDFVTSLVANLAEKSMFGLPYGVWVLIYLACMIVADKMRNQYQ